MTTNATPRPCMTQNRHPRLCTVLIIAAIALLGLGGCSALTKATSSSQWIEYPVQGTNCVGDALPALCAPDRQLQAKEARLMAGVEATDDDPAGDFMEKDVNPAADVVRLMTVGTVRCTGPADIERSVIYDPVTGKIETTVKTSNSDWLGSLFGGMWNTARGLMSFIGQVAGGAGNKI